jgi:hypothetical protein
MANPLIVREVTIARAAILARHYILSNLKKSFAKRRSIMLWGAPGIGKTDITYQLADELFAEKSAIVRQLSGLHRVPLIDLRLNIREPVDLRGVPMPDKETGTTKWFSTDELPRVERDGEFGILMLDEINTASPQMMAVAMQLILEGRLGDYVLPPGWIIVAAGNRVGDRTAVQKMPNALKNRFSHIHIVPDADAYCAWAVQNDVAPVMIAFVRFRPALIHRMPAGDENAFPTPRSLTRAADFVDAPDDLRRDLMAGEVGDDVAGEIDGFIKLYSSIGSVQSILDNPDTAKLPVEPSQKYAICTALASKATRANFSKIMIYAARLDGEGQAVLIHDATLREPKLKETAAYSKWSVDNQHLIH